MTLKFNTEVLPAEYGAKTWCAVIGRVVNGELISQPDLDIEAGR
jgi:hypothetical protein